ncbi:hypothetical protein FEQ02_06548 [Burkholderia pseudomultivorans]|nr:hypothetical protein [Burkholderia pseudomultivorans]
MSRVGEQHERIHLSALVGMHGGRLGIELHVAAALKHGRNAHRQILVEAIQPGVWILAKERGAQQHEDRLAEPGPATYEHVADIAKEAGEPVGGAKLGRKRGECRAQRSGFLAQVPVDPVAIENTTQR